VRRRALMPPITCRWTLSIVHLLFVLLRGIPVAGLLLGRKRPLDWRKWQDESRVGDAGECQFAQSWKMRIWSVGTHRALSKVRFYRSCAAYWNGSCLRCWVLTSFLKAERDMQQHAARLLLSAYWDSSSSVTLFS